jgi:hypothetical protein
MLFSSAHEPEERAMTDRQDEHVPRGDHVPADAQEENEAKRAEPGVDSAAQRGHGAHGRGVLGREEHVDPATPTPDAAKGSDRGGSSGFDGGRGGGSVIDKRSPD